MSDVVVYNFETCKEMCNDAAQSSINNTIIWMFIFNLIFWTVMKITITYWPDYIDYIAFAGLIFACAMSLILVFL